MLCALVATFMLAAYFPYLTYGVPLASGVFVMFAVIEAGKRWALLTYAASAVIVFFFAEPEAKLIYLCFGGFYPILKALLEGLKNRVIEYILKFAGFNAAVLIAYGVFAGLFGINIEQISDFGAYGIALLLLAANGVFILYDIALTRIAGFYMWKIHPFVRKFIK